MARITPSVAEKFLARTGRSGVLVSVSRRPGSSEEEAGVEGNWHAGRELFLLGKYRSTNLLLKMGFCTLSGQPTHAASF